MVGLLEIMIWLFCIYLVYKGVEIFQIAYVGKSGKGMILGIIAIGIAIIVGMVAVFLEQSMVGSIQQNFKDIPKNPF